jgi:hypothetical protein
MQSVDLDQAEFYGSVSRPAAQAPRTPAECLGCGSQLAGRAEGIQSIGGKMMQLYASRCGRKRRVVVAAR